MGETWVKFYRKMLDNEMLKNHKLWAFWSYCLLRANYKDRTIFFNNCEVKLEPGQFIFGRKKAAQDLNMSERQIRTSLELMKKAGNLTIQTTNKYSIITIVNWHIYQQENGRNDQQDDQQTTSKRPQTRKKEYSPTSFEVRLSLFFYNHILKRKPDFKKPNIQTWAKYFDYMIRIDGRNIDNIKNLIVWIQRDDFWQNNILSPSKLREKYDMVEMKANKEQYQEPKSEPCEW
jgi:hypothetical protein